MSCEQERERNEIRHANRCPLTVGSIIVKVSTTQKNLYTLWPH